MMVVSVWMFLARWADTEREEDDEDEDVAAAESTSDWLFLIAVWLTHTWFKLLLRNGLSVIRERYQKKILEKSNLI